MTLRRPPHIPQRRPVYIGCEGASEASYAGLPQDMLRDADLAVHLVIEDLGLEHEGASGWHARELEGLICARHDAGRRTVVTTNLPLRGEGSIQRRYGDRVLSRLLDATHGCKAIGCGNDDLRSRGPTKARAPHWTDDRAEDPS